MQQVKQNNSNREPISCPVTNQRIAHIDWTTRKLYLWCKCATCKGWHEYDLDAMEREHKSASEHVA